MSEVSGHVVDDALVGVTAEHLPDAGHFLRGDRRGKEALLRSSKSRQRVLHALVGDRLLFHRVNERFECRGLCVDVATADQDAVASGCDGLDTRIGH